MNLKRSYVRIKQWWVGVVRSEIACKVGNTIVCERIHGGSTLADDHVHMIPGGTPMLILEVVPEHPDSENIRCKVLVEGAIVSGIIVMDHEEKRVIS
jgi:hypothetical protein